MKMNVVLLAGGMGTRLAEETEVRPKPLIEIGGLPILVHIMGLYASCGFENFIVAAGYKGWQIKDYFAQFHLAHSDWSFHLRHGRQEVLHSVLPDWRVKVIDTGLHTMTGGRLLRLRDHIGQHPVMVTYGDGVADLDIRDLLRFHQSHGKLATVTAVRPPARFGRLGLEDDLVTDFAEKPQAEAGWINGGFFVFQPEIFDYLSDDTCILERDPLTRLAAEGRLMAYRHDGFWQPMDTLREKRLLEDLWASGQAPWKRWEGRDEFGFLQGPARAGHRPHGVQGSVARNVA